MLSFLSGSCLLALSLARATQMQKIVRWTPKPIQSGWNYFASINSELFQFGLKTTEPLPVLHSISSWRSIFHAHCTLCIINRKKKYKRMHTNYNKNSNTRIRYAREKERWAQFSLIQKITVHRHWFCSKYTDLCVCVCQTTSFSFKRENLALLKIKCDANCVTKWNLLQSKREFKIYWIKSQSSLPHSLCRLHYNFLMCARIALGWNKSVIWWLLI